MTDYTSQAPVLRNLTETLHRLGLKWDELVIEHHEKADWTIRGTVVYGEVKV